MEGVLLESAMKYQEQTSSSPALPEPALILYLQVCVIPTHLIQPAK